jgi:two-component system, sensor histidine kinase PdtaS
MRGRMALLLGFAMLPAGVIAMQVGLDAAAARQSAYEESLSRRALQSIAAERSAIDEVREMLRVLSTAPALQEVGSGGCGEWLDGVIGQYPYVAKIEVTAEDGRILCSVPRAPAGAVAAASELRARARARDAFAMGYVEYDSAANQPALAALEPIRAGDRRIGFVGASIGADALHDLLNRSRGLDGARAALADSAGRVIAESAPRSQAPLPGLPLPGQIRDHLGPNPSLIEVEGGTAVVAPLHPPDLYAVMSWTLERPIWTRWGEIAASVAAPLLIWMIAIGAGWVAIEVFVAWPLSSLEVAARRYARGEDIPDPPALRGATDEIRSLRRTLAAMAKTLRGRELRLVEALAEERALLREVHHRVKNNLQMVSSLLNIQARGAGDESEARGLARAHDRVQLLALAHQHIYASGEVRGLRLDDLAAEIARQLLHSRGTPTKDVTLTLEFAEARVDADQAVPLAFLIGEAISSVLDALTGAGPAGLRLHLAQDANGETRFAIDAVHDGYVAGDCGPGPRLIDAFARQLGAAVARDARRPYPLWVRVPAPNR